MKAGAASLAAAAGLYILQASCSEGPAGTSPTDIDSVVVSPSSATVVINDTARFVATVTGQHPDHRVRWWAVHGVIDSTGLYTALGTAGRDTVRAVSVVDSTKIGTAHVAVITGIESVIVSPESATIVVGDTLRFTANVTGANPNQEVTWSTARGTIDSLGLYRTPDVATADTVTAVSRTDTTKWAAATVTVTAGQIAFMRIDTTTFVWNDDIYIGYILSDGLVNVKRLTTDPGQDLYPTWSPRADRIAFTSHNGHKPQNGLSIINADGTGETQLRAACDSASVFEPEWSPDGSRIAMGCWSGAGGIGVINPDGTGWVMLLDASGCTRCPSNPSWSPDGKKIAFSGPAGGGFDVFVMNADGSKAVNITNTGLDGQPVWSPDGKRIAFSRYKPEERRTQIWLMNADGTSQVQLTDDPIGAVDPTWSHDGTRIAYAGGCCNGPTMDIWIVNIDGSRPVNITKSPSTPERFPGWRR